MLNDPVLRFVYEYTELMWLEVSENELSLLACDDTLAQINKNC